ncbi:MAG: hypothetical protein ACYC7L_07490 [Nitrospirota bacterium]
MNKNLSRMVADLFVKSKGGEDLSSKIDRLRDELRKSIDSESALFGKFRGLLDSFREIIPEEKQRYHAAIKALSTTSKMSQQEIIKAVNGQLEELRIIEKGLMPAIPVWREDLKVMEAKAREVGGEIAKLREKITRLEDEEEGIRKGMAAREKELTLIEKAMKELFAEIAVEISTIKDKVEEFTAENAPVQPIAQTAPLAPSSDIPVENAVVEEKAADEKKIEFEAPPAPMDAKFQKTCPMCGGRMNLHTSDKLWLCYTCAYEEPDAGGAQGSRNESGEFMGSSALEPTPPSSTFTVPVGDLSSDDDVGSKKRSSSAKQPASKTKPCPSCRKTMHYHPEERAWRCPSCYYETRSIG